MVNTMMSSHAINRMKMVFTVSETVSSSIIRCWYDEWHIFPLFLLSSHQSLMLEAETVNKTLDASLIFLIGIVGGGVQLGPLGTVATNRPILPAPGDYDEGEIGGMIDRGNRSTRRKPAPMPLCPPQNQGRGGKPATNRWMPAYFSYTDFHTKRLHYLEPRWLTCPWQPVYQSLFFITEDGNH
jgi:hypothetical protein